MTIKIAGIVKNPMFGVIARKIKMRASGLIFML
jgi:hypothetical protein